MKQAFKAGYVGIIGRPNVGKSTLLNTLLDLKLSIVTRKPQTTRWNLLGVKTTDKAQIVFVDTPGFQKNPKIALDKFMNKAVNSVLSSIDIVLFIIEVNKWTEIDQLVFQQLTNMNSKNIILVINKIDKLSKKSDLLVFINELKTKTGLSNIIPVSAQHNDGLDVLENIITNSLPVSDLIFPEDQLSDKPERFFAAEYIREKLFLRLNDEIPYRLTVTIELFNEEENIIHISAVIWVEKDSHKSIVIGKAGSVLKSVGQSARIDMETFFNKKVNLKTWVKVRENWADSEKLLNQFGYQN